MCVRAGCVCACCARVRVQGGARRLPSQNSNYFYFIFGKFILGNEEKRCVGKRDVLPPLPPPHSPQHLPYLLHTILPLRLLRNHHAGEGVTNYCLDLISVLTMAFRIKIFILAVIIVRHPGDVNFKSYNNITQFIQFRFSYNSRKFIVCR